MAHDVHGGGRPVEETGRHELLFDTDLLLLSFRALFGRRRRSIGTVQSLVIVVVVLVRCRNVGRRGHNMVVVHGRWTIVVVIEVILIMIVVHFLGTLDAQRR